MKQYKFCIGEVVFLEHKVVLDVPEGVSAIDISESIEKECHSISDLIECVEKFGCKQVDFVKDIHGESDISVNTCKKIKKDGLKNE
ncbi:hypothetical protein ACWTV9_19505 [Clostridioides difficile]